MSDDQSRDDHGRWSTGGGSGGDVHPAVAASLAHAEKMRAQVGPTPPAHPDVFPVPAVHRAAYTEAAGHHAVQIHEAVERAHALHSGVAADIPHLEGLVNQGATTGKERNRDAINAGGLDHDAAAEAVRTAREAVHTLRDVAADRGVEERYEEPPDYHVGEYGLAKGARSARAEFSARLPATLTKLSDLAEAHDALGKAAKAAQSDLKKKDRAQEREVENTTDNDGLPKNVRPELSAAHDRAFAEADRQGVEFGHHPYDDARDHADALIAGEEDRRYASRHDHEALGRVAEQAKAAAWSARNTAATLKRLEAKVIATEARRAAKASSRKGADGDDDAQ